MMLFAAAAMLLLALAYLALALASGRFRDLRTTRNRRHAGAFVPEDQSGPRH